MANFGVRRFLLLHRGEFTPLIMLFIAMLLGVVAHWLGFHPAIGAYFAGLFLHADYFVHTKTKKVKNEEGEVIEQEKEDDLFKQTNHVIEHLAFTIFGPIFFVNLGGKLQFDLAVVLDALPAVIILYTVVVVLQVLSASVAARFTGRYKWHERRNDWIWDVGAGRVSIYRYQYCICSTSVDRHYPVLYPDVYRVSAEYHRAGQPQVVETLLSWIKQLQVLGITLSRPQPAPIPQDMPEYKEMMEAEKRRYIKDPAD